MFIANKNGQSLVNHSLAVGLLSTILFDKNFSEEKFNELREILNIDSINVLKYKNIKNVIFNAGLFHDLGKLDDNFQNYIGKITSADVEHFDVQNEDFDINEYPLHHEISFALLSSLQQLNVPKLKPFEKNALLYTVYYHHANPLRDDPDKFKNSFNILNAKGFDQSIFLKNVKIFISNLQDVLPKVMKSYISAEGISEEDLSDVNELSKLMIKPDFQSGAYLKNQNQESESAEFFKNAIMFLMRSILISADRIVSSLSKEMLNGIVEDGDFDLLLHCLEKDDVHNINAEIIDMSSSFEYSDRSIAQEKTASDLNRDDVMVLKGAAGVGKTKIMLEWIKNRNNNKQNIIIVPKVSIGDSLFKEIKDNYLPTVSVEIITGETQLKSVKGNVKQNDQLFSSDIVITTIDQIVNMMLSHKKIDLFLYVLGQNIIFDEFHEFMNQPAILMLFIQFVFLKQMNENSSCLLVSATPNMFLVKEKLKIKNKNIITIKSFNEKTYNIQLKTFKDHIHNKNAKNEMFEQQEMGTICIFNTATKAQLSAISAIKDGEQNTLVHHSKFLKEDKKYNVKKIFKEFGKRNPTQMNVLRAGPIIQASFDISTNKMLTEISNIDDVFQRLGRVNRWGLSNNANYIIYIPEDLNKTGSLIKGFERNNHENSTKLFINYIMSKKEQLKKITLNDFYQLYDDFFNRKEVKNAYQEDFEKMKVSADDIFKMGFEPVKVKAKEIKKEKGIVSSKSGIRGSANIFCVVNNATVNKNGDFNVEEVIDIKKQTLSFNVSEFYGFENQNKYIEESRDQMAKYGKKQKALNDVLVNLKSKSYQAKKKIATVSPFIIKSLAKNEDMPIFLSFTQKTKKIEFEDQYFNVNYENVKIGVLKQKYL